MSAGNQLQSQQSIPTGNGDLPHHAPPLQVICFCLLLISSLKIALLGFQQIRQASKESTGSSDTDSSSDDESIQTVPGPGVPGVEADKKETKETEAGAEISALVNYVQPVHFSSFENAESK